MNKILSAFCITICAVGLGCQSHVTPKEFNLPAPGTIIDSVSQHIDDPLNDFNFTVTLLADSNVKDRVYDVRVAYGYDAANGRFMMPKGLAEYKLVMKKSPEPYTYVIGFMRPDDTTFYDYFQVVGKKNAIAMQYIKTYTFQ